MTDKVLIRYRRSDGTSFAVLGNGWRYDGSSIIDATSDMELDIKLAQARYDDRWVTMEGNHVLIGGNGLIKAGVGGRLKGRRFGMRFKDYENGKKLIRPYKAFKGQKTNSQNAAGARLLRKKIDSIKSRVNQLQNLNAKNLNLLNSLDKKLTRATQKMNLADETWKKNGPSDELKRKRDLAMENFDKLMAEAKKLHESKQKNDIEISKLQKRISFYESKILKGKTVSNNKIKIQVAAVDMALKASKNLSDKHREELGNIMMNNMTAEQARFYGNFLRIAAYRNTYYDTAKKTGYFSPYQNSVYMNLNRNKWERASGLNRNGAFNTKIHEEFHQMDYLLTHTQLGKYHSMNGHDLFAFTSTRTVTGKKMSDAIEKDIVNFINSTIDKVNKDNSRNNGVPSLRHIKSTDRLSMEIKRQIILELQQKFPGGKARADIVMFTDALGLQTRGKILPYDNGFWGHKKAYCTKKGKDGATSETWANFGAYKFTSDKASKKVIEKLMPNTIKTLNEILDEMVSKYPEWDNI